MRVVTVLPVLISISRGPSPVWPIASTALTIKFTKTGTYEYMCTVPGHAAAGMKGDLKVT